MSKHERPTAETIVGANTPQQGVQPTPGKRALTDGPTIGDTFVDHGYVCDGVEAPSKTCYLDPAQRQRLHGQLVAYMGQAFTNHKLALEKVRVDKLIEKADDLSWVTTLVLDALGGQVTGSLIKALGKIDLGKVLSPDRVQSIVKLMVDGRKKSTTAMMKAEQGAEGNHAKGEALGYIEYMKREVDLSVVTLIEQIPATANDAELTWLHDSFKAVDEHSQHAYEQAILDKIAAYRKSGAASIGRRNVERPTDTLLGAGTMLVARNTRVIELRFASGERPELRFQHWDMSYDDVETTREEYVFPRRFQPTVPYTESPEMGDRVPDSFAAVAIARHVGTWGVAPAVIQIDESDFTPNVWGYDRWRRAMERRYPAMKLQSPPKPVLDLSGPSIKAGSDDLAGAVAKTNDPLGMKGGK